MNRTPQFLTRLLNAIRGSDAAEDVDAFKELIHTIEKDEKTEQIDSLTASERKVLGDKLLKRIDQAIAKKQEVRQERATRSFLHAPWMRVAASLLLLMASGAMVLVAFPEWGEQLTRVERTILPGKRDEIRLSDGSVVSLNGGSTITYSRWFLGDTRKITLKGEAFFNVTRDEDKPFVVEAGNVTTTVLGTSFNVKSYADLEHVTVSVATGKVKISKEGQQLSTLTASQEITVSEDGEYVVKESVDMTARLAWRDGRLVFDHYSMKEVATLLSNYYDVQIIFMDSTVGAKTITADFDSGTSLDKVLKVMSLVNRFSYDIDNEKVLLGTKREKN